MNEENRKESKYIRSLSSADAATYIIEKYRDGWPAAITCRSWEKRDQIRLANKFIKGRVYASGSGYKDFLSFMSFDAFLRVVESGLGDVPADKIQLLSYYLIPCLNNVAHSDKQIKRVEGFAKRLSEIRT